MQKRVARAHDPKCTLSQNGYGDNYQHYFNFYPYLTFTFLNLVIKLNITNWSKYLRASVKKDLHFQPKGVLSGSPGLSFSDRADRMLYLPEKSSFAKPGKYLRQESSVQPVSAFVIIHTCPWRLACINNLSAKI